MSKLSSVRLIMLSESIKNCKANCAKTIDMIEADVKTQTDKQLSWSLMEMYANLDRLEIFVDQKLNEAKKKEGIKK